MKVLVIGFGSIGSRHAAILSEMLEVESVTILSSQTNLSYPTIRQYQEILKLDPDYIVIASDTSKHLEQLQYLEEHFVGKTILVEKPIFHHYHPFLVSNNRVFVGYNLRFHPLIQQMKQLSSGRQLWSINAFCGSYLPDWRPGRDYSSTSSAKKASGGGVLLDLSHELDYIQWIAGDLSLDYSFNRHISNLQIETDDFLTLVGTTTQGARITLGLNYFTRIPVRQIILDGEGISIQANLITNTMSATVDDQTTDYSWPKLERNDTYIAQHKSILNGLTENLCSFSDGVGIMKLIETIQSN